MSVPLLQLKEDLADLHRMVDIRQLVNSRDKSSRLRRKHVMDRKVRWPVASKVKEWGYINDDLKGILEELKGTAESKSISSTKREKGRTSKGCISIRIHLSLWSLNSLKRK